MLKSDFLIIVVEVVASVVISVVASVLPDEQIIFPFNLNLVTFGAFVDSFRC